MTKHALAARLCTQLLALFLVATLGAGVIGCEDAAQDDSTAGQPDTTPDPSDEQSEEVRSEKQRVANPDVSQQQQDALVAGNTAFALDLYKEIAGEDKNLFYSPFSISTALTMTYAGARGETAAQMADTLHLSADQDQVHPAFNWLEAHLMDLSEEPIHEESSPFELAVANAIWGQTGFGFEVDFLDTLALNYGAGLRTLDFQSAPDASRETINTWVEEKTQDRIEDLIPDGVIKPTTRLVLTNAIFFKASWLHAFDADSTAPADFRLRDESTVRADLMHQTTELNYAQMDDFQAVELPYDGGDVSMLVLLPEDLDAFEQNFSAETLRDTVGALEPKEVKLTLPKFEFTLDLGLSQTLKAMGMTQAFDSGADFSGMAVGPTLFISDVVHKAFVAVDEEGTEAAAATAVVVGTDSAPVLERVEFRADHPFVFMIRDNQTGSLLFVGRVLDPTAAG